MPTPPRYGQPDQDEPQEYAAKKGWYRNDRGLWKFRPWGLEGPLPHTGYPPPPSLFPLR